MNPARRRWVVGAALLALSPSALAAEGFAGLLQRIKPSVVLIGSYLETASPRFRFCGTGFVIGDGLRIVTNAHVLTEATEAAPPGSRLMVQFWQGGGRWAGRAASIQSQSRSHDLALLRVDGSPAPPLALAEPALLSEGSDIAFMGFPIGGALGFSHVTHRGMVSSVTPLTPPQAHAGVLNPAAIRQLRESGIDIYQLDAVAYPGNSGGPVFDPVSGEVVAVINMVFTKAGREGALSAPSGIAYAIPVGRVHELLRR